MITDKATYVDLERSFSFYDLDCIEKSVEINLENIRKQIKLLDSNRERCLKVLNIIETKKTQLDESVTGGK